MKANKKPHRRIVSIVLALAMFCSAFSIFSALAMPVSAASEFSPYTVKYVTNWDNSYSFSTGDVVYGTPSDHLTPGFYCVAQDIPAASGMDISYLLPINNWHVAYYGIVFGFSAAPIWDSNYSYQAGDVVRDVYGTFYCSKANDNKSSLHSSNWQLLNFVTTSVPTVRVAIKNNTEIESFLISPDTYELAYNGVIEDLSKVFTVEALPVVMPQEYTWSVVASPDGSPTDLAIITDDTLSVSTDISKKLLSNGTFYLRATSTYDPSKHADVEITVTPAPRITITHPASDITVNYNDSIAANADSQQVVWTISHGSGLASISNSGAITILQKGIAQGGTFKIRATSVANPDIYAERSITVTAAPFITSKMQAWELAIGDVQDIRSWFNIPPYVLNNYAFDFIGDNCGASISDSNLDLTGAVAGTIEIQVYGTGDYSLQQPVTVSVTIKEKTSQQDLDAISAMLADIATGIYGSDVSGSFSSPSIFNDSIESWKEMGE